MSRKVYDGGQLVEDWNDIARTYTRYSGGVIVEQRPYTVAEIAAIAGAQYGLDEQVLLAAQAAEAAAEAASAAAGRAEVALAAATVGSTSLPPLRAALARHRTYPARVGFYGSSTTLGVGASEAATSYVNIFARRLQSAYPSGIEGYEYGVTTPGTLVFNPPSAVLPGVQVVNGAVSGTTAASYIDATAMININVLQPDCLVHMVGSNDYFFGVAPATYRSQIETQLDDIDATLTKPSCHVLIHAYRRLDVTTPAYAWDEYGQALKAIAAARDNVVFIDISDEYDRLDHAGADPYGLISGDLIHQTDAGHALTADLVYRAFTPAPSEPVAPLVLSDSFTRPPGAPGVAEFPAGATYTALSGTWAVAAGGLGLTAGGSIAVEAGVADLDYTAVITLGAANPTPGVLFRVSSDTDRLGFFLNPSGTAVQLFRMSSGVNTSVASASYTFTRTHYVVRVIARKDKISCFVNGALVLTYTLSAGDQTKFGVFTKVGFRASTAPSDLKFWGLTVRRIL